MFFALAFTVAQIADKDMLKEVHQAMQQAMANGTPFHDFQKRLKPYLMAKGWLAPIGEPTDELLKAHHKHLGQRLRVIYHTNKQTAYAAGQWQRIQQTKEFLPYLQYMPSLSVNKRDGHKRYYGIIRPVDDPIWASLIPPNGFNCKCWVKQITKSEAKRQGISEPIELETETIKNPATGEMIQTPKGVHFSFNHNHDRLTAMLKLAEDKHGTAFGERLKHELGEFMLDLIAEPNFTRDLAVVTSQAFVARFNQLSEIIKDEQGNRENSLALRKKYAKGENYAVATISPSIQDALGSQTAIVWLSDDTIIKMLAHHPEMNLLPIFKDTHLVMKNAVKIVKKDDLNVVYFSVQDKNYIATVKMTRDKTELYLTTIYIVRDKEFNKMLNKN